MSNIYSNTIEVVIVSIIYLFIGSTASFLLNRLTPREPEEETTTQLIITILIKTTLLAAVTYILSLYLSENFRIFDFNRDSKGHVLVDSVGRNFLAIGLFLNYDRRLEILYDRIYN